MRRCLGNRSMSRWYWPDSVSRAARGARAVGSKPATHSRRCESSPVPVALTSHCGLRSCCHGIPAAAPRCWSDLDAIPVSEALPAPRVSPFPAVFQDVSLVVPVGVPAQAVADAVREGAGELLEDLALFDVFSGPQIGEDRKSLTFALRFRAPDRTLTEDDASAARDAAVRRAAELLGAELRA
jgi:hypothetical protein